MLLFSSAAKYVVGPDGNYRLSPANAAALVPDTDRDSGQSVPTVLMEPQSEDERPEVVLDGCGTV